MSVFVCVCVCVSFSHSLSLSPRSFSLFLCIFYCFFKKTIYANHVGLLLFFVNLILCLYGWPMYYTYLSSFRLIGFFPLSSNAHAHAGIFYTIICSAYITNNASAHHTHIYTHTQYTKHADICTIIHNHIYPPSNTFSHIHTHIHPHRTPNRDELQTQV